MLARTVCLILSLLTLVACSESEKSFKPRVAYSWNAPSPEQANILPFFWLYRKDIKDINEYALLVKSATDQMQPGRRVLFSWDLHRQMAYQKNGDFLYNKDGSIAGCQTAEGFKPYRSLWWDNGVQVVKQLFDDFFAAYHKIGGELDVFVLDFEQGFSYWHLKSLAKSYGCELSHYLDAIQNDSRFQKWQDQLSFDDLKSMDRWYENDHEVEWAALTWLHLAEYINQAVYEPLKKYYPRADLSNYGYYYQSKRFDVPDTFGERKQRYSDGVHVGTHQSQEAYGWANLHPSMTLDDQPYPSTPYNAFRFSVNKIRAMQLSSTVLLSPWVAYKGFSDSHLHDNDYYQELILHTLISDIDYLLYWNPHQQKDFNKEDDVLLAKLIKQVNDLIDGQAASSMTQDLAGWLDDVLITKVKLGNGHQLWRLTVKAQNEQNIMTQVVTQRPLRIEVEGKSYDFPDMELVVGLQQLSSKGLWLKSIKAN